LNAIVARQRLSWASAGGDKTGISSPLEIGNAKISEKHKISSLIPISWVNYCSDSLFANMTLTLQKKSVHCSGIMQSWNCSSLNPLPLGCKCRLRKSGANFSAISLCWVTI